MFQPFLKNFSHFHKNLKPTASNPKSLQITVHYYGSTVFIAARQGWTTETFWKHNFIPRCCKIDITWYISGEYHGVKYNRLIIRNNHGYFVVGFALKLKVKKFDCESVLCYGDNFFIHVFFLWNDDNLKPYIGNIFNYNWEATYFLMLFLIHFSERLSLIPLCSQRL